VRRNETASGVDSAATYDTPLNLPPSFRPVLEFTPMIFLEASEDEYAAPPLSLEQRMPLLYLPSDVISKKLLAHQEIEWVNPMGNAA